MWLVGGPWWTVLLSLFRLIRCGLVRCRLTTRGHVRCRRGGLGRSAISAIATAKNKDSRSGGKTCLVDEVAADDAEATKKGHPVWIEVDVVGGLAHEVADRIVGGQQRPDLLPHHFR